MTVSSVPAQNFTVIKSGLLWRKRTHLLGQASRRAINNSLIMIGLIGPIGLGGLGGCALASLPKGLSAIEKQTVAELDTRNYIPRSADERAAILTQDLFAQAAFWSREFELNPADLEAAINLSNTLRRLGNPTQSLVIATQTRALYPRDAALMIEMAASHISLGQPKEAVELLDQALSKNMRSGRAWSLKGAALDQLEMYDQAREHYTKALSYSPSDPSIIANVGLSYALEGDPRTAEVWLRRAANMPGASANVRQNLALVLELQGNVQEAEKWNNWDKTTSNKRQQASPSLPPARHSQLKTKLQTQPTQTQSVRPHAGAANGPTARMPAASSSPSQPVTTLSPIQNWAGRANGSNGNGTAISGPKTASDAARLVHESRRRTNINQDKSPQTAKTIGEVRTNADKILDQISQKNTPKRTIAQQHNAHYQQRLNARQQMAQAQTGRNLQFRNPYQYNPQNTRPQNTRPQNTSAQNTRAQTNRAQNYNSQNIETMRRPVYPPTQPVLNQENTQQNTGIAPYYRPSTGMAYGQYANNAQMAAQYPANPYASNAPYQAQTNSRSPARSRR